MYKEPGLSVFGSRLQETEQVAYVLLFAQRAGVHVPELVKTGVGGPDAALLVTVRPAGRPLGSLEPEAITDAVLDAVWRESAAMHAVGISHGNLDQTRVVLAPDGDVAFDDFSASEVSGAEYYANRDDAAIVVQTALLVGNDRAVAAATRALGKERLAEIIPLVQPAALPAKSVGVRSTSARH